MLSLLSSLEWSDTTVYKPWIRARFGRETGEYTVEARSGYTLSVLNWYCSQFKNNHLTEMFCGTEEAHRLVYHSS